MGEVVAGAELPQVRFRESSSTAATTTSAARSLASVSGQGEVVPTAAARPALLGPWVACARRLRRAAGRPGGSGPPGAGADVAAGRLDDVQREAPSSRAASPVLRREGRPEIAWARRAASRRQAGTGQLGEQPGRPHAGCPGRQVTVAATVVIADGSGDQEPRAVAC